MDGMIGSAAADPRFCYDTAFARNLGWLTEWEQQTLRGKRVAIAGMGGVGGAHLIALARFGIGGFNIADPDRFELVNFNRQAGATMATLGRAKVEVLAERAREINPEVRLAAFPEGVDMANLDAFLAGADLYIDALDFFVLDIRRALSRRCAELGIPVVNAAPLGMGAAMLVFLPGGMSFEDWFRLDGLSQDRQYVSYLLGMAPSGLHRRHLVDIGRVDFVGRRAPSAIAGCELAAGIAAVTTVKLLLGRGPVRAVPWYHHFDPFCGRWVVKRMRLGNRDPVQRLKIALARRLAAGLARRIPVPDGPAPEGDLEHILDRARWAPSGDNTQPWRFEPAGPASVTVHLTDRADRDLYDYRGGEPTLLSGGMLLESMRIAAGGRERGCAWRYLGRDGPRHRIAVSFPPLPGTMPDPLYAALPSRSVDRRPYRLARLGEGDKAALAAALGDGLELAWHESLVERWRLARLGARATAIRLRVPEIFTLHREVLDWDREFSPTGIPAAAAGLHRASLPLMRWAMRRWPRLRLLNRLGGALLAAVQMDYLPGLCSAGYVTIRLPRAATARPEPPDLLAAGAAIQRFWLTATRLGLALQPGFATLVFGHYGRTGAPFTAAPPTRRRARALGRAADAFFGRASDDLVFLARLGRPRRRHTLARSVRLPLAELMLREPPAASEEQKAAWERLATPSPAPARRQAAGSRRA
jgi:sulfur-carrier protein adenylyltransferase/sulfurtransferase